MNDNSNQHGAVVPAGAYHDPFAALAASLRRPGMDGNILRFVRGHWAAGLEGNKGMDGARLVACIDQLMVGWRKWVNKQVVDARIGLVAEGYTPPVRADLGDTDEKLWPLDADGESSDPWQYAFFLQLHEPDDSTIKYIWTASSRGAQTEVGNLSGAFADKRKRAPGALPIVELESDHYRHRRYGRVDVPFLSIVGWVGEETPAAQAQVGGKPNDDIDDELPF